VNQDSHFIADEEFPAFVDDSTMIYLKSTYNHIAAFVIKTGNTEKTIGTRGVATDRYFDYHSGKIAYSGYRPDLRWGFRDYSEIRIVDVKTGSDKSITTKTKYFSPAFSDNGRSIVAVQVNPDGKSILHILDAETGKLLTAIPNTAGLFYTYPKFYNDNILVVAVRDKAGKMGIIQVDIATGKHQHLTTSSFDPIGYITVQQDTIYFTATNAHNDKLYALSVKDKKLFELKNERLQNSIGNYQPAVSANKLAWVGFTAYGNQVQQVYKKAVKWVTIPASATDNLSDFNISALNKNEAADLLARVSDTSFKTSKYNKGYNLFNFHSLIPDVSDPNYRLSLTGENVLNTFQSELFFNYNSNEDYKQVGFEATYGALYPYISAGADYIFDRQRFYRQSRVYFNEFNIHGGLQVPLNFSRGKQLTGLNLSSDIYYTQTNYSDAFTVFNRNYTYLNNVLSFSTRVQQARQHINPRFGQSLLLIYKTGLSIKGSQYLAQGTFYFPGLWPNHSLVLTAAHQQHGKDDEASFSNNFAFSRGYTANNFYKMDRAGANYHFPIAYPDAGLANTIYLMRIRGNVFYEHTCVNDFYVDGRKFKADFRSVGAGVFFDTKFFNEHALSFGLRYSYLLDDDIFGGTGHNRIEIVMPVSIF
jgi:hypothetical protein